MMITGTEAAMRLCGPRANNKAPWAQSAARGVADGTDGGMEGQIRGRMERRGERRRDAE